MSLHLTSRLDGFYFLNHPQSLRLSASLPSVSHRSHFESLVVCAGRRKKKVGYQRIARFLFNSLSLLSPSRQILPQPLDLVITDLGGVDGGGRGGGRGLGFWRGWGRFDGWRRKRNRIPILLIVSVVLWICGFCNISGKEIKSDKVLKVLGVCVFGVSMIKELKREARYLVFGFLCFSASLAFGFKQENFVRLASEMKSFSSALLCKRKSRRRFK